MAHLGDETGQQIVQHIMGRRSRFLSATRNTFPSDIQALDWSSLLFSVPVLACLPHTLSGCHPSSLKMLFPWLTFQCNPFSFHHILHSVPAANSPGTFVRA